MLTTIITVIFTIIVDITIWWLYSGSNINSSNDNSDNGDSVNNNNNDNTNTTNNDKNEGEN